jgi:hypothetical protein
MGWIMVSALKPGMILSQPVVNVYRQQLAERGAVLNSRLIGLFQSWDILEVEVQGASEPTLQEIEAKMEASPVLRQRAAMIDDRFRGAGSHPFIIELRRLVKQLAVQEHEGERVSQ